MWRITGLLMVQWDKFKVITTLNLTQLLLREEKLMCSSLVLVILGAQV